MIVYENDFIILKVSGHSWFYLLKRDLATYPRKYDVEPAQLPNYFVKYHEKIEPKLGDW